MMLKTLLISLLIQFSIFSFSQQLHYNNDKLYLPDCPEKYITEYNVQTKIPSHLYNIAKDILRLRTGKHAAQMQIESCTVINLEEYYKVHPDSVYKNFIPSKFYKINWSDKKIGVDNYAYIIMLDSYNQVIHMGFPNGYQTEGFDFLCLDSAKTMTDHIVLKDTIKYNTPEINLYYNFSENDLIWSFRYPIAKNNYNSEIITENNEPNKTTYPAFPTTRIIDYSMRWKRKFKEDTFIYFEF